MKWSIHVSFTFAQELHPKPRKKVAVLFKLHYLWDRQSWGGRVLTFEKAASLRAQRRCVTCECRTLAQSNQGNAWSNQNIQNRTKESRLPLRFADSFREGFGLEIYEILHRQRIKKRSELILSPTQERNYAVMIGIKFVLLDAIY